MIFRLYQHGDAASGPLGIKEITKRLNAAGYRTKRGARFGVGTLHGILTNPVYVGEWTFNKRESKTLRQKPATEHITIAVPPIIERASFDTVQSTLKARNPRVEAPRVVTGPILLTGLAVCASCEGGMTLRTGTSRSGRVHRYYTCSACARSGKVACKGRSIRMDTLDELVVEHLTDRLFTTERLTELLTSITGNRAEKAAEVDGRIIALQREATDAEDKLKRLYRMVEDGIAEMDDILRERVTSLRLDRERAQAALDRVRAQRLPTQVIPLEIVEQFGRVMRENIRSGNVPFRKAYLRSVIDRVEVGDATVRIVGDTATLEQAIARHAGNSDTPEGAFGVRSSVRKWRARKDSNL